MEQLKPGCPYCKSSFNAIDVSQQKIYGPVLYQCYAYCKTCLARGPLTNDPESAIAAWNTRAEAVPTIPIARLDAWLQRRNQFVEELYTPIDITMDWEGASVITNEYADGVLGTLQDLIDLLNEECKP